MRWAVGTPERIEYDAAEEELGRVRRLLDAAPPPLRALLAEEMRSARDRYTAAFMALRAANGGDE